MIWGREADATHKGWIALMGAVAKPSNPVIARGLKEIREGLASRTAEKGKAHARALAIDAAAGAPWRSALGIDCLLERRRTMQRNCPNWKKGSADRFLTDGRRPGRAPVVE